ncbi:ribose-phosphate diphosphokinase [Candidatus Woesearchaeota archaeon]|nr:ribose-phosphate diphosphokinase [Candidatus Woesearchaeota archaeon]
MLNKFPDDELHIRFNSDLKNKDIALVQSFYKNISDCVIEVIFAAQTARELGAKKVILVAPYFPYLRQDKRFHKGEVVSQKIIAGLIGKYFDAVYIMDPHLHRKNKLEDIFKIKSRKLTASSLIADYVKKHITNPIIIGPDEESYKWAKNVAEMLGVQSRILKKKRYSSYHVEVKLNKKIDLKNRNAVIVDDIVSTGHTILETAKILKKLGAKKIYCICVHGIFANDSLSKLRKAGINVVTTNTIPNKVAKIDVSGVIGKELKL